MTLADLIEQNRAAIERLCNVTIHVLKPGEKPPPGCVPVLIPIRQLQNDRPVA